MIKPEFWRSVQVSDLSVTARLLFIGMWNFSDDGGNQPDCCRRLKMSIFPGDVFTLEQVGEWLAELIEGGLVLPYVVGTARFTHITGWKHQYIQKPTYQYPPPPDSDSGTVGVTEKKN